MSREKGAMEEEVLQVLYTAAAGSSGTTMPGERLQSSKMSNRFHYFLHDTESWTYAGMKLDI
jgi:hypothetical protein